jgi:hypothetical protein
MSARTLSATKSRRPEIKSTIRKYFADNNIQTKIDLSNHEKTKEKRIDVLLMEKNFDLFVQWEKQPIRATALSVLKEKTRVTYNLANDVLVEEEPLIELDYCVTNNIQDGCPLFNEYLEVQGIQGIQETILDPIISVQENIQESSAESEEKKKKEEQQATDIDLFDEFIAENKALKKSLKKLCHRIDELTSVVQLLSEQSQSPRVEIILAVEPEKDTQLNKHQHIMNVFTSILIIVFVYLCI